MKQLIFATDNSWAALVARITLGLIIFPHGAQKMLGWFGGYGFKGTMGFFTGTANLPWVIGFAVIMIEFFGSISLIAGFATRIWAALLVLLMLGIILTSHLQQGFFMNWFGNQKGEGYEFHLLVIGLALVSFIAGAGKYSVDAAIGK